jgi:hypothetical protein
MSHTDTKPQTDTKPDATATAPANGEKGKPGRKPGQTVKRPDTSAFSLDSITGAVAAPALVRTLAQPKLERKPEQIAMDKVAERAHEAWVKAGCPGAWDKMPVITYYLDPTHVEGFKYLIRRATDFHGTRPRFGSPARVTKKLIAEMTAAGTPIPPEYEGREILAWAVLDKRPRPTKPTTTDPKTAATTANSPAK